MIVFGTRSTNLKNGQIINADCPMCKTQTSMRYSIFGKYAHVYYIPLVPVKKITVAECNTCKTTFEYIVLPDATRRKLDFEKEKQGVKIPYWMYSGLLIIAGLVSFGFYESKKAEANTAEYVKNPKVGDVYSFKLDNGHFTTARVDKVARTEVYVTFSDYEIDLESDIDRVDEPQNYTKQKDTFDLIAMQRLYNEKTIFEINRKE